MASLNHRWSDQARESLQLEPHQALPLVTRARQARARCKVIPFNAIFESACLTYGSLRERVTQLCEQYPDVPVRVLAQAIVLACLEG